MLRVEGMLFRVFGLLLFTAAVLFVGLSVSFYAFRDDILQVSDPVSERVAQTVSRIERDELLDPRRKDKLRAVVLDVAGHPGVHRVSLLDRSGIVRISSEPRLEGVPLMNEMIEYVIRRGSRSFPMTRRYGEQDVTETAHPLRGNGGVAAVLLVGENTEGGNRKSPHTPRYTITLMILLGLLIIIVFGIYINRFFASLRKITGTINRFARGETEERIDLSPDSPLVILASSFNQVAEGYRHTIEDKERHVQILARMAGGVAHEVRNPLGGIRGFAELLKKELGNDDKRVRYVDYMLKEVDVLELLVQTVLDFARPITARCTPMPMESLVEALVPAVQHRISELEQEGIRIVFQPVVHPAAERIEADPLLLRQLFLNLLRNGCDAMSDRGGVLEFLARPATSGDAEGVDAEVAARSITILVSDTGEGMDEETLQKLFQPFFTTKSSGTGLGLSICQKIVEAHGGRIAVSSRSGRGTSFRVVLPRKHSEG